MAAFQAAAERAAERAAAAKSGGGGVEEGGGGAAAAGAAQDGAAKDGARAGQGRVACGRGAPPAEQRRFCCKGAPAWPRPPTRVRRTRRQVRPTPSRSGRAACRSHSAPPPGERSGGALGVVPHATMRAPAHASTCLMPQAQALRPRRRGAQACFPAAGCWSRASRATASTTTSATAPTAATSPAPRRARRRRAAAPPRCCPAHYVPPPPPHPVTRRLGRAHAPPARRPLRPSACAGPRKARAVGGTALTARARAGCALPKPSRLPRARHRMRAAASPPSSAHAARAAAQGAHFQCADGRRMSTAFVDDGIRDCKGGEDERASTLGAAS